MSIKMIDNDIALYERRGTTWDSAIGEYTSRTYVSSFSGNVSRRYYGGTDTRSGKARQTGFVDKEHVDWSVRHYIPFLAAVRPERLLKELTSITPQSAAMCRIDDQRQVIGDSPCVVFRAKSVEFWVDLDKSFAVRRIVTHPNGLRIDVGYKKTHDSVWIPSTWHGVSLRRGKPQQRFSGKVTEFVLIPSMNASALDFQFPEQTIVTDRTAGIEVYVAGPGNSKKIIKRD